MSATDDPTVEQIDRKLEALGSMMTDERVDELQQKRAELTGEADPETDDPLDTDVDVVEALRGTDAERLSDSDAIDEEIERREEKLELLGVVLPDDRVDEVHDEIEALRAAREVTSPYRTNTPEALAERIEVRQG
jgi:predicted CopG family antitoxin